MQKIITKKAAMFRLFRTLKKQSSELFLVRRQSEDSKGASGSIKSKRGAMFGLDARIALTIFGALSVISGASLYSAIQEAKATAFIVEMNEIGKAWEQYYLDTGEILEKRDANIGNPGAYYSLKTLHLVQDSGVNGWSGPYLPYATDVPSNILEHTQFGQVYIFTLNDADAWNSWSSGYCRAGENCFAWSLINGIPSDDLAKAIDEKLDDGDGAMSGNFRWRYYNTDVYEYYLKYAPIKNPND